MKTSPVSPEEAKHTTEVESVQRRGARPVSGEAPSQGGGAVVDSAAMGRRRSLAQRRTAMQATEGTLIASGLGTAGAEAAAPRRLRPIFYSEYVNRKQVQWTPFHVMNILSWLQFKII